ncbi:MAG: dienelactone hydrolase family protein [Microthrixaceae bacterium]
MDLTLPSGTAASITRAESPSRGLVIIPDIWGLRPLFADLCADLSTRTGWTVAAIEPFPGQDLPDAAAPDAMAERAAAMTRQVDAELIGDAVAAADATGCEAVGLIGFCMGGMYALKAAASGRFDRIVSFYGMAHVPEHFDGPGQGDPVEALERRGDVQVMSIIGTADPLVPESHAVDLEAAGVVVHRYADADHGFVHDPSRPTHRAEDAADAWAKTLVFLDA